MIEQVKRYEHRNHAHVNDCEFLEAEDGYYVSYDDYAILQAECERLRGELAEIKVHKHVSDSLIREVFLRNGFTIKQGQTDLKPYVFAAARDLIDSVSVLTQQQAEG